MRCHKCGEGCVGCVCLAIRDRDADGNGDGHGEGWLRKELFRGADVKVSWMLNIFRVDVEGVV
jgi:hypothetical protein